MRVITVILLFMIFGVLARKDKQQMLQGLKYTGEDPQLASLQNDADWLDKMVGNSEKNVPDTTKVYNNKKFLVLPAASDFLGSRKNEGIKPLEQQDDAEIVIPS